MTFVTRLLNDEKMSDLCREYGISRKTGYKIFERFKVEGIRGLQNQSRAPRRIPNKTTVIIEKLIIDLREIHPTWGAPKIKSYLERKHPVIKFPAVSTIHTILQKHDLVKRRRARSVFKSTGTTLERPLQVNELWCADFKGQFKMANKQYCYPLTITDQHSRFILAADAMERIDEDECIASFERTFAEYGLPARIRTDNGVPFGTRSYFGLSRLSVFWLRQGISLERIEPGHPEQNGTHERMHRTMKETLKSAANILKQQEDLDSFRVVFNRERPHQALQMQTPSDLYQKSTRAFNPSPEPLSYPEHDSTYTVSRCGAIFVNKKRIYVGTPFAGENLGVKEIDEELWKISFGSYDLGFFNHETMKLEIGVNPFLQPNAD